MDPNLRFKMSNEHGREALDAKLAKKFAFIAEKPADQLWSFYDTFDWRLFKRSLLLCQSGPKVTLSNLADGESYSSPNLSKAPAFYWDFPAGALQTALKPATKLRALLVNTQVHAESFTYRILNDDEKTVARVDYTETRVAGEDDAPVLGAYITLRPVRGYPKYIRQLTQHLQQDALDISIEQDTYQMALDAIGKQTGDYSAALGLHLEPQMRADEATKVIFRRLLEVIRANEAGVKADIDTEFLHEFRVAVRRTRSALSQIKKVFPPATTAKWKADFRTLGSFTNELRDLDVYLLSEDDYRALLPASIRDDVAPLFAYLRAQRARALNKVRAGLDSAEYARTLSEWEAFLSDATVEQPEAPNAAAPAFDLARQRIYKQYRKIIRDGNKILANTEDEMLHELRIECKKLRYLLEFFASLFPTEELKLLVKQLKRLQDNLGEFNDLSMQEEYLLQIAGELPVDDSQSRRALVATGYLIETMERRRQVVKAGFAETFAIFTSPANQKLFRELLSNGGVQAES